MSGFSNQVSIGDCVDRVKTWNPRRDSTSNAFRYIDIASVSQGEKKIVPKGEISTCEAPSRARQLVRIGDVLVSTVRPNLNAVAYVTREHDGATASTGFCVLRPNSDRLDGRYLFHWVRTPTFVAEMVRKATGQSYPAVSDKIVKSSSLPLPSIEQQRRIAAILDEADALRHGRQRAIYRQGDLGWAIFYDVVGDPLTNPHGWADGPTLNEVADIVSGITKGRKLRGKETQEVPYLAVANVQDNYLSLGGVKTISATRQEIDKFKLEECDLLLTEGGDPDKLGRGTLWRGELPLCIHQNHIFRVRLHDNELRPQFVNWLIGSRWGKAYFSRLAKQTTGIASINKTQLRNFPLLLPPLKVQKSFEQRIEESDRLLATMAGALQKTDYFFSSLQQRAFRGEL